MKRVSQFHGSLRAMIGLAKLTMRELIRTGAAPISFLIYAIFLALFKSDSRLDLQAASARLIDHGLGGIGVATMFLAVFFGMQLAGRGEGQTRAPFLLRRTVGPAAFYWGRLFGMTSVLVLFGLLAGSLLVVHHVVRFGDPNESFKLESRVESRDFSSNRETKFMRTRGDSVAVPFRIDPSLLLQESGRGIVKVRFSPIVVLMKEIVNASANCQVKVQLKDAHSDWSASQTIQIHQGRAKRFEFRLPKKNTPRDIVLTMENRSDKFLLKFRQNDLQLITRSRSFFGGVMRASLSLALLASILATFALFFREHMGFGPSLVAGFGLVIVSVSVELLEFGVLAQASASLREFVIAIVTTALPDAGEFDVIQRLARGRDVGWDIPGQLVIRLVNGSVLMGLIAGWADSRGGKE